MEESARIRSITFVHDGDIHTCTLGELMETEHRLHKRKGMPPTTSTGPERIIAIEDRGEYYLVFYRLGSGDRSPSANPFMVGKRATRRLVLADGTAEDPFVYP